MTVNKNNAAEVAAAIRLVSNINFKDKPLEYLPFVDALARGEKVRHNTAGERFDGFVFDSDVANYSIIKEKRPLTIQDVKEGDVFSYEGVVSVATKIDSEYIRWTVKNNAAEVAKAIRLLSTINFGAKPLEYLEFIDAIAAGKEVRCGTYNDDVWSFNSPPSEYKIVKKSRHLSMKDVKQEEIFRRGDEEYLAVSVSPSEVTYIILVGRNKGRRNTTCILVDVEIFRDGRWVSEVKE